MWDWLNWPVRPIVWTYNSMIAFFPALHRFVTEREWIRSAVKLIDCEVDRGLLTKVEPRLVVRFRGVNAALSRIGRFKVSGHYAVGNNRFSGETTLDDMRPSVVKSTEWFSFAIAQFLRPEVAKVIIDLAANDGAIRISLQHIQIEFFIVDRKGRPRGDGFRLAMPPELNVTTNTPQWQVGSLVGRVSA